MIAIMHLLAGERDTNTHTHANPLICVTLEVVIYTGTFCSSPVHLTQSHWLLCWVLLSLSLQLLSKRRDCWHCRFTLDAALCFYCVFIHVCVEWVWVGLCACTKRDPGCFGNDRFITTQLNIIIKSFISNIERSLHLNIVIPLWYSIIFFFFFLMIREFVTVF